MLVLSRKQSEVIKIGDDIELTILRIGPHAVRIGIEAPRDVQVTRPDMKHGPNGQEAANAR